MRKIILLITFTLYIGIIFGQDSTKATRTTTQNTASPLTLPTPPPPPGTFPGTGSIVGATNVTYGQTYIYSFSGTSYPNITWQATNGFIINSTTTSAQVEWAGSVEIVSNNLSTSSDNPLIYALGGPNAPPPSYRLKTSGQTMEGSISIYSNGGLIASLTVTITVPPIHGGSISPSAQTIVEGQQPTSLSYSGASGGTGVAFTYQWQTSTDNLTWTDIPGATGLTYNPGVPASKYNYYHVSVKQGSDSETSSTATIEKILTATPPPISPVQDDNYTIDLSKPVGTTTGNINVGADGGVQYIVPIGVLPGTNSLQPSIRLVYNSRGDVGIAAKGWSLSCFSEIKRTGRSYYFDSHTAPVNFNDTNDVFSLDGHRLFPISGVNGADGTVYGKENEDFSKIISHGGSSSTGPDWFEVIQKDGTILEYGKGINSKFLSGGLTYTWLLNRVIDRNGNYCLFKYNIDPSEYAYALTEIDYTGNDAAGLQPYNKVLFSYSIKQAPASTVQYKDGVQKETPYLLDSISVINSAGTAFSRYIMAYKVQQGQYYLKTITEQGSDGSAKNPLVFRYGADGATPPVALSSSLGGLETDGSIYSGNFGGTGTDGVISAILKPDNNGQTQYLGFNMYGDLAKDPNNPALHLDYSENLNASNLVYDLPTGKRGKYDALTSDYNGDGKADVLFAGFSDSSGVRKLEKIQINLTKLLPNGKLGYDSIVNNNMPVIAGDGKFNYVGKTYILPGDFDGDGYQDYILILGKGDIYHYKAFFCSPHKNVYNVEVSGLGIQTNTLYQYEYYASSIINCQVRPVDIDGDGKTDLMVSNNEGTHFIKINNAGTSTAYVLEATEAFSSGDINATLPTYSGDFNGDGITDFLVRSTPETGNNSSSQHTGMYGPWNILYGSPSGLKEQPFYFKYAPALKGDGYSNTHLLMVSDLNKDGRADIWQSLDFIDGTTGVLKSRHIAYYKTDGVNSEDGLNGFISQTDTTATSINSDVNKEPVFGDFNGDGKTDMMTIQGSSVRFIYPIPERENQMLAQVTNGLGSKTKITYDRINKEVVYTKTAGAESNSLFPPFESALYVASKINTSNGIGGEANTTYHYSDATFNPTRGFLGFHQQNTQNEETGINSFTVVKFNPNFLRPTINFRYTLNQTNDTISKQVISDTLMAVSTDPENRRFTYQVNKIIGYDGISGAATQVVNTYDAFGNITKAVTTKGSLTNGVFTGAVETKTVSTAYGIHNTPVAAFPNSITYSNTRSGQAAVTKLSTYSYDNKGNTLVVTHYAGTAKAVTTTYSYSNTGNETKIVQASAGLSSRTLEKFYDPKGRFLIQTKQTGSGITKNAYFTYDDGGNLLSDKNSAGLTTTYLYTGFNNLKKKTLPEGYSIDIAYNWETASGKRFSISQTRPGGGRDIKIWYDDLGRAVAKQTSGYNNKNATQEFTYDAKGQLISSTAPHYSTETAVTTNYFYDNVSRLTKVSNAKNYTSFAFAKQTGGKYKVTTTKSSGQSSYIITDATGQIVNASDNGGLLSYSYDSWGNRIKTMMGGKALITNSYDSYGRLAAITELNSGTFNYSYDAFNQLINQSDPLGHSYTINYDDFGRVSSRVGPEGTTSYSYYNNSTNGYNDDHIAKVIGFYGEETDFTYDEKMRLNSKKMVMLNN